MGLRPTAKILEWKSAATKGVRARTRPHGCVRRLAPSPRNPNSSIPPLPPFRAFRRSPDRIRGETSRRLQAGPRTLHEPHSRPGRGYRVRELRFKGVYHHGRGSERKEGKPPASVSVFSTLLASKVAVETLDAIPFH